MRLKVGDLAQDFETMDIKGNKIKLSDYKGQPIILGFYRHKGCPFCNRRVHQIMGQNYRLIQSGVKIILLFESSNEKLKSSIYHKGINPWPIVGNPELDIYEKYGVEKSTIKMLNTVFHSSLFKAQRETKDLNLEHDRNATLNLIPADFFIDEDFRIAKAHYGNHIDDHVNFNELKDFAGISGLVTKKFKKKIVKI